MKKSVALSLVTGMATMLVLMAGRTSQAQSGVDVSDSARIIDSLTTPGSGTIYETNWLSSTIQAFALNGPYLGVFATVANPTGLIFDGAGNLYVSSDNPGAYSIMKIAADGTVSTFANSGLSGPHGLVLDAAGNLYVANMLGNTIVKFTPTGVGTIFANQTEGLAEPFDLAFDSAGNLYVANGKGGPTRTGSVIKFTPTGVGSVFATRGLHLADGLAFDAAGNLYVSNMDSNTIEKFAPDGTDLGVFASTGMNEPMGLLFDSAGNLYAANRGNDTIEKFSSTGADLGVFAHTYRNPHFMTMFRPTETPTPTPSPTVTPTPTPTATPTVQVTVQTTPVGVSFTVDGTTYSSTQIFSWASGSSHTIATTSPQSGGTGVRYVWTKWSDNGAISHSVSPTTNKTYTATFSTQYYLTMTHGTGGTVSPASGWRNSGAAGSITATPANGYSFAGWSGSGTGSYAGTNNPASITMNGPITETATFTHN